MTSSGISTTASLASLKLGGSPVANVGANVGINVLNVLSAAVNKRAATWNAITGELDYTVRALDVNLLGAGQLANVNVVAAESRCKGIVNLNAVTTSVASSLAPGQGATPTVTVTNTGSVAAPNTVIRIPVPPSAYELGSPSVTNSGSCNTTTDPAYVTCTVTVPAGSNVKVSLPVTLKSSAGANAPTWGPILIDAVSTPIAEVTGTTITKSTTATLVTTNPPLTTGGSVTVDTAANLPAGKTAVATLKIANLGPSDASTTVSIPVGGLPAGVTVDSAKVRNGAACTVPQNGSDITCAATVGGAGYVLVDVTGKATVTTPPGGTWEPAGVAATLNGVAVTGGGKLFTVGDPDANLTGGVTITKAVATPGGNKSTATIGVANAGIAAATTTITVPAPPAGYTLDPVTTTGGGTCTTDATTRETQCQNVVVPAKGSVTVSVPMAVTSGTTTDWTVQSPSQVTAVSGSTTGYTTGTVASLNPHHTLAMTATGPAADTIAPGQTATMTVNAYNQGPSDAHAAAFVVVPPPDTILGTIGGAAGNRCSAILLANAARCTVDLTANGAAAVLSVPLSVALLHNPATPITGGCLSFDNDTTCSGGSVTDPALPTITLHTPLTGRVAAVFDPAVIITPGGSGTAKLRMLATQPESGLTVTIPKTALPSGFHVTGASVNGGNCTYGGADVQCTGVSLATNTAKTVDLTVAVDPSVAPLTAWPVVDATVAAGADTVPVLLGVLASTGTPGYRLSATVGVPAAGTVEPGDNTTVTVQVKNNGPSNATAATFTIWALGNTAVSAQPTATCPLVTSTTVTCTVTLASGVSTADLTIPLTVAGNADPDTPLTGGCVDLDGAAGCGGSDDTAIPDITLKVPFSAKASITVDRADVTPGSTATAKVHVAATHGDLAGLTVTIPTTDLAATGMTVTGVTGAGCTTGGNAITCPNVAITDGHTADLVLTVSAPANATAGTTWKVTGLRVADGAESITADPDVARVAAARTGLTANVAVSGGTLLPGGGTTLDVTVDNTGPSDAPGAQFKVIAPVGTTFDAAHLPAECALTDARHARCTLDLDAADPAVTLHLPLTIDTDVVPGLALSGGCVDLDLSNTCTISTDGLIPQITIGVPLALRLGLTAAPAQVVPGASPATSTVSLVSTRAESGLKVTIPLTAKPAALTLGTVTPPAGATCNTVGALLVCDNVDLPSPNQPVTITIAAAAPSSAQPAIWAATGIKVEAGSDAAYELAELAVIGPAQTAVSATVTMPGAGTVRAGDTPTVSVNVGNTGPSDAAAVLFTVSAPAGTTFGTLPSPGPCISLSVTLAGCTVSLVAQAPATVLPFVVQVPAGADPFTPLSGGCVEFDIVPGCGSHDRAIPQIDLVVPFDRRATVTSTPATISPGGTADAVVRVGATHDLLSGVTVTVPGPPNGFTVSSASATGGGNCTVTATVDCTGIAIADGTSIDVTLHLAAAPSLAPGTGWTATGITVSNGLGQLTADRALATAGPRQVTLVPAVQPPSPTLTPGGTGNLTVDVANTGLSDAVPATFGLIPPDGLTFGTPPANCAAVPAPSHEVTCTLPTLAAGGAAASLTLPVTVDAAADPSRKLTGGCLDGNNDGFCASNPKDRALADIDLATPFNRQVAVQTQPFVGTGAGEAKILVTAGQSQAGLTVVVPLAGVPQAAVNVDDQNVGSDHGSPCTADAIAITCGGITLNQGETATVTIPVTVDPGATAATVWNAAPITVSRGPGNTVDVNAVLVRGAAPDYHLTAIVDALVGTVLPGGTASIQVHITNTGPGAANGVQVAVRAPAGTTFDTGALPAGCQATSAALLTCTINLNAGATANWTLPVQIPGTASVSTPIASGCVDLDGNGACGASDVNLPSIQLRAPLTAVILGGTGATITPGATGTATVTLTAAAARTGVDLTLGTLGRPAGVTVTAATLGGQNCPITNDVVHCNGVTVPTAATTALTLTLAADPAAVAGAAWTGALTLVNGLEIAVLHPALASVGSASNNLDVTVGVPGDEVVLPGGTAYLAVTLRNDGPSARPGASVSLKAPPGTTFATPPAPCTKVSDTLVTCTTDLGVESKTVLLGLDVAANATPGSTRPGRLLRGQPDRPLRPARRPGHPVLQARQAVLHQGAAEHRRQHPPAGRHRHRLRLGQRRPGPHRADRRHSAQPAARPHRHGRGRPGVLHLHPGRRDQLHRRHREGRHRPPDRHHRPGRSVDGRRGLLDAHGHPDRRLRRHQPGHRHRRAHHGAG